MSTIREKIIEYLENNSRKTIKEIAKAIQENEPSVRAKIYGIKYGLLAKGQIIKVAHKKRTGFFSLNDLGKEAIEELKNFLKACLKCDDKELREIKPLEIFSDCNDIELRAKITGFIEQLKKLNGID